MIDKDDFDAWRDNPVTQAVFSAHKKLAEQAKQAWVSASWNGGDLKPELLADLRATARVSEDLVMLTHDELETILADE